VSAGASRIFAPGLLEGQVLLVSGAGSGIGRETARELTRLGATVAGCGRRIEPLEETGEMLLEQPGTFEAFACDIRDEEAVGEMVARICESHGRIDTLVNNAGVSVAHRGDVLDVTPESFDRVMGVNLRGTFFLTQAVARRMLADAPGPAHRSIVTISSANAVVVAPDRAEYCFAKTALSMLAKVFATRLAPHGIASYEVRPGVIRTDMTRVAAAKYDKLIGEGLTPIARWGEPDDVGRTVATLACGDLPFVTGDAVHVDGGLHIHRL
jgi:NAD(P)-dependent dehydrogenase (short-subunit alcohol dehydrogenase family)